MAFVLMLKNVGGKIVHRGPEFLGSTISHSNFYLLLEGWLVCNFAVFYHNYHKLPYLGPLRVVFVLFHAFGGGGGKWKLFGVLVLLVICFWVFFHLVSFVCLLFGVFSTQKRAFKHHYLLCRALLSTILRSFTEKQSHALKISSSGSPFSPH